MSRTMLHVSRFTHPALRFAFYVIVLSFLLALALPVIAQDGSGDDPAPTRVVTADDVNEIAREVYCPVCESTPLDVCQTQACADWRDVIRQKLEEGKSKQDIFDYFSNLYGDRVLAEAPRRGFTLLVWVLPAIMVPVGLIFFGRYMRNLKEAAEQTKPAGETAVPPATPADDYISQIEQELKNN